MERTKLMEFIEKNLRQQGSASASAVGVLAVELAKHVPCVVHIGDKQESEGGYIYNVTDEQKEIDAIIEALNESEEAAVCVHDKGVTLHFTHIEVADTMAQCYLTTFDGVYTLSLNKEEGFSKLVFSESGTAVFSSDFSNDFVKQEDE